MRPAVMRRSALPPSGSDAVMPAGRRKNPGDRAPARYRRLFIVTYGRSGSTLLQGVLNALPGYLVRGENNDLLGELQELFEKLPRHREGTASPARKPRASTPEMPFFGYERFRDDTYAQGLARFMDGMLADAAPRASLRCLGFKEIRYTPTDVAAKVDFLRRLYPGCAIVYNIRNPEAVAASEFQKNKPPEYFSGFNAVLRDMAQFDPDACLVTYEDLVAGTGTLPKLYEFLQEPFDREAFAAVLAKKHSYHSPKKGSFYSNMPGEVQVVRDLDGLDLLVVDRVTTKGRQTQIDGFIVGAQGAPAERFDKLLDGQGRSLPFAAEYGLPSPKVAKTLGPGEAAQARFRLTFDRPDPEALSVFFADDELALTVHAITGQASTPG